MAGADAVGGSGFADALRDADLGGKFGGFGALPQGLDFVAPGFVLGRGDFADAPLDRAEGMLAGKGAGLEAEGSGGIAGGAGVFNDGALGDFVVGGFDAEVAPAVAEGLFVVDAVVFFGAGVGAEIDDVFGKAAEVFERGVAVKCAFVAGRRRVVPARFVELGPTAGLRVDVAGVFGDKLSDLAACGARVAGEEVLDFPRAVAEFELERGDFEAANLVDVAGLVVAGEELHVEVPRHGHPAAHGVVVEVVVRAGAEVDVGDEAVDGVEAEVGLDVHILAPPILGFAVRAAAKLVPFAPCVAGVAAGDVLDAVLVGDGDSVGPAVVFEPRAVGVFDGLVEAPKVAVVLGLALLFLGGDDAEVDGLAVGCGEAGELVGAEGNRFVEPGHAAVFLHPRGGAAVHGKAVPALLAEAPPLVAHGHFVGGEELEAPLVFPALVGAGAAAIMECDVVVHMAVVDECAGEAAVVEAAIILAVADVFDVRDEGENGERLLQFAAEDDGRRFAGLRCAGPVGRAIPDEVGEIRAWVVGVGQAHAGTVAAGGGEAIADEPPVCLRGGGDGAGPDVVFRTQVAVAALVIQRKILPARFVFRIALAEVCAGLDELHVGHDGLDALAVRDGGGKDDGLAGLWRIRLVLDPRAGRRSAGGSDGVWRAGSGARAAFHLAGEGERYIHREVAAIEGGIDRLHGEDVFALEEKARGIVDADFLPLASLVLLGESLQVQSARRDVQPGDFLAVEPDHAAIVHARP